MITFDHGPDEPLDERPAGPLSSATGPAPAAIVLSSAQAGLTRAGVAYAVARATEVVTPHHLVLVWAGTGFSRAEPPGKPVRQTNRAAGRLAAAARRRTGGGRVAGRRIVRARALRPVLRGGNRRRRTAGHAGHRPRGARRPAVPDLPDAGARARHRPDRHPGRVRRTATRSRQRRGSTPDRVACLAHWLGSKLTTLWYAGEPADAETVTFFTGQACRSGGSADGTTLWGSKSQSPALTSSFTRPVRTR